MNTNRRQLSLGALAMGAALIVPKMVSAAPERLARGTIVLDGITTTARDRYHRLVLPVARSIRCENWLRQNKPSTASLIVEFDRFDDALAERTTKLVNQHPVLDIVQLKVTDMFELKSARLVYFVDCYEERKSILWLEMPLWGA